MGDSLMRYQYLSLVDAIERGGNPLGERMRVGTDSVQRLKYGKGRGDVLRGDAFRVWNDFYEKTSKGLHGHEFCDCVRHPFKLYPPPIIENRYYRHPSGLRMTFLGVYGPEHALVGHFWPRSDPTAQPSPGAPTTGRRENSAAFYESTYQKLNRSGMLEPLLSGAFRGAFDRLDWELSWLDAVERLVPRLDPTRRLLRRPGLVPDFGAANASVSAIFSADPPPWRKPVNIGFFALKMDAVGRAIARAHWALWANVSEHWAGFGPAAECGRADSNWRVCKHGGKWASQAQLVAHVLPRFAGAYATLPRDAQNSNQDNCRGTVKHLDANGWKTEREHGLLERCVADFFTVPTAPPVPAAAGLAAPPGRRIPALTLSYGARLPFVARMLLAYARLWPDHPFVFYVPFNASGAFDAPVWGRVNASYDAASLVAAPPPPASARR
ncbi:cupin-like domain-containing protein [Aureococcus anophagefferens]|nr:cupin-like domain-containing protein [Aureococcus anophagefferens]